MKLVNLCKENNYLQIYLPLNIYISQDFSILIHLTIVLVIYTFIFFTLYLSIYLLTSLALAISISLFISTEFNCVQQQQQLFQLQQLENFQNVNLSGTQASGGGGVGEDSQQEGNVTASVLSK